MKKPDLEGRPAEEAAAEARRDGDEARKRILARRATFVAAALAGVSTACGKEPATQPQPCLSQPFVVDDAGPLPCLSPPPRPESLPDDGTLPPQVCLSPMPPTHETDGPPPMPCLSVQEPPADAGKPKPPPRPCLKVAPPRDR
ncbi:MAG: hypothetical protein KF764_18520 [Labilithrix sp.]|nr:hypothetical protein [Labilithrix sp.]